MAYFGVFHENQRTAREQKVLNGISQANIFYYNNDMPTANTLSRLLTAVQSGDTLFIDTLDALGDGPKEAKQMINILKDLKASKSTLKTIKITLCFTFFRPKSSKSQCCFSDNPSKITVL